MIDLHGGNPDYDISDVDGRLMPVDPARLYYSEFILSPEECRILIDEIDIMNRQEALVSAPRPGDLPRVDTDCRNNMIVNGTTPFMEEAWNRLAFAADRGKAAFGAGDRVLRAGQRQCLVYGPGHFFRPHADGYVVRRNTEGKLAWQRNTPERELVSIVWLSEQVARPGKPYSHTGGEFYFPHINGGEMLKSAPGRMVLFPSHPGYVHGVKRIHSGNRYTITQWWKVFDD